MHATGQFDVKITAGDHSPDPTIASYSLSKQYHGDLEATAQGEMLSAGDPKTGDAGYVAIERVAGTLGGKNGTFALMQIATMSRASGSELTVTIVPGSGTGELTSINGAMKIMVAHGEHSYVLDYTL